MANTELFVRNQPGGPFTVVDERMTTGDVFFVNSTKTVTGGDVVGKGKSPDYPFLTIDYAIGQAAASNDDLILVDSAHAETITSSITMDKIGLSIVGLGTGFDRPIISSNLAGDTLTMTAARSTVENLIFDYPQTDAQNAQVNIAAQYCALINTYHIMSNGTDNLDSCITIEATGDDCLIDGIVIQNPAAECVSAIALEAAIVYVEIKNFKIIDGAGFSTAAIDDGTAATLGLFIHDGIASNVKASTAVLDFTNNSEGCVHKVFMNGRHGTIADNVVAGAMNFFGCWVTGAAGASAALNLAPAVDTD